MGVARLDWRSPTAGEVVFPSLILRATHVIKCSFHVRGRHVAVCILIAVGLGAVSFALDDARAGEILHSDDPFIQADQRLGEKGLEEAKVYAQHLKGGAGKAVRAWLATSPSRERKRRQKFESALAELERTSIEQWGSIATLLAPLESAATSVLEARIRRNLAQLQLETGLAPSAGLRSARKYRDIAAQLGWRRGEADALTYESDALQLLDRYEEAAGPLKALIIICRELREPVRLASAQAGVAGLLGRLGRVRAASDLFADVLGRLGQITPKDEAGMRSKALAEAKTRFGLAFVLQMHGDLAGGLLHLTEALNLWKQVPDTPSHPDAELLQGNLQLEIGDFPGAMATYERLLEKTSPGSWSEGALRNNLGEALLREEEHDLAQGELVKARTILSAVGDHGNAAVADRNLGEALSIVDPKGARAIWQRALSAQKDAPVELARTLIVMCRDGLRRKDVVLAQRSLDRAKALAIDPIHRSVIMDLLELEGRVRLAQGKPTEALTLFQQAMDLIEDVVQGLADEEIWQTRAQRARVFNGAIEAAFRAGNHKTQLEALERTRAAALRQTLGNRQSLRRAVLSRKQLALLEAAQWEVSLARKALLDPSPSRRGKMLRKERGILKAAESKLRELANRLEREHKRLAGYARVRTARLGELRGHLRDGEALLYIALPGRSGFALLVTKEGVADIHLPGGRKVAALATRLRAQLSDSGTDEVLDGGTGAEAASSWQKTRADLHAVLCDPIRQHPAFKKASIRKLLLCQDPLCSGLPASMQWHSEADAPVEVSMIPSGSVLALIRTRSGARGTGLFAIGDPDYEYEAPGTAEPATTRGWELSRLRHGGEEIQIITGRKTKGEKNRVHVGRAATEANFRAGVRSEHRWRSILVVCHGKVDTWSHRNSGLALAQDDKHDGFLTVPEIFALDIKADLVTLSACDSGRGRAVEGEGVVGFPRAFLAAGAPRVIASLWKVDDASTKALMVKFYELWRGGTRTAARALAGAQRHVASQAKWAHPEYWAAWSLWGVPE